MSDPTAPSAACHRPGPDLGVGLLDRLDSPDCLVYGIGNVGRSDDGLGWAFIDWVEQVGRWSRARLVRGYQLLLEDAHLLSEVRAVLFVDSTKDGDVPAYAVTRPAPSFDVSFSSHALSVPCLLATTRTCFDRVPDVYLLAIRGHAWGLEIGMTDAATANLAAALSHVAGGRATVDPAGFIPEPVSSASPTPTTTWGQRPPDHTPTPATPTSATSTPWRPT